MTSFELVLLGGFQARAAGRVIDVPGRKERALLALLALPPGASRSRDRLAGLLWGDRGDKQAGDSLRQAILRLRKAFDSVQPLPLLTDRGSVTLDRAMVAVDVQEFEQLIAEGTPQAVARAISLYRGDLLEGLDIGDPAFEEWLQVERQRLRDMVREALSTLLESHFSSGERDQAGAVARRLLILDPLREAAHRALMKIYAERGQAALALKQYQLCHDALQTELGVRPEPETERLYQSIKEKRATSRRTPGHASAAALAAESSAPLDLPLPTKNVEPPDFSAKPAVAVLPFTNMSGNPEQEYFSDGITEDIITELSRFRSLSVIARWSSFHYKGQSPKIQDIGRELGVQYVVEGSVRKAGNRVRVTAQLVEAETGNHLWAERYDRELEDIFAVQDEVVREIASVVPGQLEDAVTNRARRKPSQSLTAYDHLLRGESFNFGAAEAVGFFKKAIEIDPHCARAHCRLAAHYAYSIFAHGTAVQEAIRLAQSFAEKALASDASDPLVHGIAAATYIMVGEHDLGRDHIAIAIALNPNDIGVIRYAGVVFTYLGDYEQGMTWHRKRLRLDPLVPDSAREAVFDNHYMARRYEDAIAVFRGWRKPPVHMHCELAAGYAQLRRMDDARAAVAEFERKKPAGYDFAMVGRAHSKMCRRPEDADHWLEGYRKAGLLE